MEWLCEWDLPAHKYSHYRPRHRALYNWQAEEPANSTAMNEKGYKINTATVDRS